MFAATKHSMTGTKLPVALSAYGTTMPSHIAGDFIAVLRTAGNSGSLNTVPGGWTAQTVNAGGGNTIWIQWVWRIATTSSTEMPLGGRVACIFKNASRVGGIQQTSWAQYPNGSRPYVYGVGLENDSGNSYVIGFCNFSSGLDFTGTSYTPIAHFSQETLFFAQPKGITVIPAQYIALGGTSWQNTQNYNCAVFEIRN